jgi:UDP-N-acetylglucosamine acyltransferase
MIDPRAVIHEGAKLGVGVEVGPFAVIGPNVTIGEGTVIGSHAVVDGWTTIGKDCRIFTHAVVGQIPQDLKYHGEQTTLEIGDRTMVREFATLHLGTQGGGGKTRVGSDCLFMAYSHVAHDCIVGDHVILANSATLAGHVTIENWVIVGGLTAIHQFVRIGEHAILGGCSAITMDVIPYVTVSGNRAKLFGLNLVGLKRRGFSEEAIQGLRRAYRALFQSKGGTLANQLKEFRETEDCAIPEVKKFVDFIAESERGVTR